MASVSRLSQVLGPSATETDTMLLSACERIATLFEDAASAQRIGAYELLREIGKGGSAQVHIGRHGDTGELWAVKHARSVELERVFREEHRNGSLLNHPNILRAHDHGVYEGRAFLIFPLLAGGTLKNRYHRERLRTPGAARDTMVTIVRAVQFAHSRAVLHCDLKHENILFDENDEPYVSDFGLARRVEASGSTRGEAWGGTPGWMSPEQVQHGAISVASDIFSLGVVLYWLLRGHLPFGSGAAFEKRVLERKAHPPLPLKGWGRGATLAWDLNRICQKALRVKPEERYRSAAELADDLERAGTNRVLKVDEGYRCRRFAKWARRSPGATFLAFETAVIAACAPLFFETATMEVRETIQVQNQFSARAQAKAVEAELRALALRIHAMAADPEVAKLVNHAGVSIPAAALEPYKEYFDSVNVFGVDGLHHARAPSVAFGDIENITYRDFFQCARAIAMALRSERAAVHPGGDVPVCVARAHRSKLDGNVKLGLAAPILRDGEMVGVAEGSTKARERFRGIQMSCGNEACATALLGPVDRAGPGEPLLAELSVLVHSRLREGQAVPLGEALSRRICGAAGCAPDPLRAFDEPIQGVRGLVITEYHDPVMDTLAVAAVAPVARTGLRVVIATPSAAAGSHIANMFLAIRKPLMLALLAGLLVWMGLQLLPHRRASRHSL